ncbi:hypothetical protein [Hanstruepera marina]|uniref:hypothetical protein n=1 Tax=Hanstruepera marina TaxID=2873265 RepID=UPI001CA75E6B|nr:hypothetical protein [Hanstruepera marina]
MIKKTFKAFIFFAVLQVLIFSCCSNTYNVYYESVNFYAYDRIDLDASSVAVEDLELSLNFLFDYIQISQLEEIKQLSNSAYATSCDDEYFYRDTVLNVNISSNEEIFNVDPGESLNEFILFINPNTLEQEPLEEMIVFINNNKGYSTSPLTMVFNETLQSDITLNFTINIELDRNRSLESTTDLITIE